MEIKVDQTSSAEAVTKEKQVKAADDSFKFTLISHIQEDELKDKLSGLMDE